MKIRKSQKNFTGPYSKVIISWFYICAYFLTQLRAMQREDFWYYLPETYGLTT